MKNQRIIFLDFIKKGQTIWFIDLLFGCLWKNNIEDGTTKLIKKLSECNGQEQYRCLYVADEKVYIPPLFANDLLIIDIKSNNLKRISLQNFIESNKPNFIDVIEYRQYLFCIPMSAKGIIRINMGNDQIDFYDIVMKNNGKDELQERPRFRRGSVYNNKIYLASCNNNIVLVFDMESCRYEENVIYDDENDGYSACCCTSEGIVLISYDNSRAVIINDRMKEDSRFELEEGIRYAVDVTNGNQVVHVGCSGSGIIKIINTGDWSIKNVNLSIGCETANTANYYPENSFTFTAKIIDEKIWIYVTARNSLCVFDFDGKKLQEFNFDKMSDETIFLLEKIEGEKLKDIILKENGKCIQENEIDNLEMYINAIVR